MKKEEIFNTLWNQYTSQNPAVQRVFDLFIQAGEEVVNDHIAFRTYDDPRVNINVLSRPFLEAGYVEKGEYHFDEKKLYAKHFEHQDDPKAPRVFISQLLTKNFSPKLQEIAKNCVDNIPENILHSPKLIHAGLVWETPSFNVYERLRQESEYAAWLYVNGFRANHFTLSVNYLQKYNSLEKVNSFLKENGFLLNDSGGEIKGTPAELLEQSSIKSDMIRLEFLEGIREIPGCYYEFARRYPDADGKLYPGFIAKSADKIFESTDFFQKGSS